MALHHLASRTQAVCAAAAVAAVATAGSGGMLAAAMRSWTPTADTTLSIPQTYGDVNGDGQMSAFDALLILSSVVGKTLPPGTTVVPYGDTNCDGKVQALDALYVLSGVVGRDPPGGCLGAQPITGLELSSHVFHLSVPQRHLPLSVVGLSHEGQAVPVPDVLWRVVADSLVVRVLHYADSPPDSVVLQPIANGRATVYAEARGLRDSAEIRNGTAMDGAVTVQVQRSGAAPLGSATVSVLRRDCETIGCQYWGLYKWATVGRADPSIVLDSLPFDSLLFRIEPSGDVHRERAYRPVPPGCSEEGTMAYATVRPGQTDSLVLAWECPPALDLRVWNPLTEAVATGAVDVTFDGTTLGRFSLSAGQLHAEIAEPVADSVDILLDSGAQWWPVELRVPRTRLGYPIDVVLTPRRWPIENGVYANDTVSLDLRTIFAPSNPDGKSFLFGSVKVALPQFVFDGTVLLEPQDANPAFLQSVGQYPTTVWFDREASNDAVTEADSVAFWEAVDTLERYVGLHLFEPAASGDVRVVKGDSTIHATGLQNGGNIFLNSWAPDVIMHELIHTEGVGHTCGWESIMSYCYTVRVPSPEDVAILELLDGIRKVHEAMPTDPYFRPSAVFKFGVLQAWRTDLVSGG